MKTMSPKASVRSPGKRCGVRTEIVCTTHRLRGSWSTTTPYTSDNPDRPDGREFCPSSLISLADFARLHNVAAPTVTGWKRRGHLVLVDGKVDVRASNARLAARPAARHGGLAKVKPIVEEPAAVADPANWSRGEAQACSRARASPSARSCTRRARPLRRPPSARRGRPPCRLRSVQASPARSHAAVAHRLAAATTPEACGALVDTEVRALLGALTADGGAK
jgi:hypothetical protein